MKELKLSIISYFKGLEPKQLAYIIGLVSFILYLPSFFFDFTYDDFHQIHNHPLVTSPSFTIDTLLFPFFEPTFPGDVFRPLSVFTYRLNFLVFGLNAPSFHFINIVLNTLVSILVFYLGNSITRNKNISFLAAIWFTIHPLHVEAVASVVGRAELLSAFLGLSSIFLFKKSLSQESSIRRITFTLLTCLVFLLGVFSKESCITLLPLIPLCCFYMYDKTSIGYEGRFRRILLASLALALTSFVYLFIRQTILNDLFLPSTSEGTYWVENPLIKEGFFNRLIPGLVLLGKYIKLLIFPLRLSADYSATFNNFWSDIYSFSGFISILFSLSFIWSAYKVRTKSFFVFGIWFLTTISIALNIAFPIGTIFAERLAYLPSIGFFLFFVLLFKNLIPKLEVDPSFFYFLFAIILAFNLFRTSLRLPVWQDNETLFSSTLVDSPNSPKAKINLGLQRYNQKRYTESSQLFQAAITEDPKRNFPYPYLVNSLIYQGKLKEAELWCRRALQMDPNNKQVAKALRRIVKVRGDFILDNSLD